MPNTALKHSTNRLKQWTITKALPIWRARAQLPDGSWVEHLTLGGMADMQAERRWRVLARQIYVYAHAVQAGWFSGDDIAKDTHKRMMQTGYVHRVDMSGTITNPMQDLYDHAFYLLAQTSLYRLTQAPEYLDKAEQILTWLDSSMSHPNGGWVEHMDAAISGPRRQNPHMHMFEASLYLYEATQDPQHLSYAHKVFGLFKAHFFKSDTQTICEFFAHDWRALPAPEGTTVEPGHAAEWIWLLHQYEKLSGIDTSSYANGLYTRLHRNAAYFLNDEEDENGIVRRESKRLWVQTELIKSHLAQAERGSIGSADMAAALIDGLFETYLTPEGLWNDQLNACGINIAQTIPVSTFYHILCMGVAAEKTTRAISA
ncbi:MAG: AGE family epimerase/isomerase [Litorimonas sp.]